MPECLKDPSVLISRMPCAPSSSSSVLECLEGLNALSARVLGMSSKFPSALRMQKWDNNSNLFCPNKQLYRGGIVLVELTQFIYLFRP